MIPCFAQRHVVYPTSKSKCKMQTLMVCFLTLIDHVKGISLYIKFVEIDEFRNLFKIENGKLRNANPPTLVTLP